jgi:type I restriction enzyme R subunit
MAGSPNQNPEQIARDAIDAQLRAAGWVIQSKDAINFHAGEGQAVREYTTDTGPADYVLFVDGQPVGVIEAKKETLGQNITVVEDQTADYSAAKLKWVQSTGVPLPFLYEATGVLTRFTDQRDPKPRSREVFSFHRPETLREWLADPLPARPAPSAPASTTSPRSTPTGLRDCQIDAITHLDALPQGRQAPRPRPDGHRLGQDLHRHHVDLPPAQARPRPPRALPRGHPQPRRAGRAGVPRLHPHRRQPQVHRTLHRRPPRSSHVPADAEVCISTIQRMYSILQGRELDASAEDENPAERSDRPPRAAPRRLLRENPARVLRSHHHR